MKYFTFTLIAVVLLVVAFAVGLAVGFDQAKMQALENYRKHDAEVEELQMEIRRLETQVRLLMK